MSTTETNGGTRPGGFRVVNFTRHMPGPLAGRLLADLGGDVVKIESPRAGDATRGFAPFIHGQGLFHVALNGGTRSLAIDSRSPHWSRVVQASARWADVALVGGLPENTKRLGLDFESLVAVNPRLVYCAITGYGEHGPWRSLPAHGLNPDAFAGLVPLEWTDGQPDPLPSYQSAGAPLAGVFAALGILAALRRRDATGEPQRVHASLFGAAVWWNWRHVTAFANLGEPWWTYGGFGGRYATYRASDGKVILVCPIERGFWRAFCDELGLPEDWKDRGSWGEGRMDHGTAYPWERAEIAKRMAEKPGDSWTAAFTRARIPFAPILSLADMLASEHVAANRIMRDVRVGDATARIPSAPVGVRAAGEDEDDGAEPPRAPELGEQTDELLEAFGLPELRGALSTAR